MNTTARWTERDRDHEHELLEQFRELKSGDPGYQQIRDELVLMNMPLVEHLARRFRDRGEPYDDLVQVGTMGLIKAVDRFDAERGAELSTYATPTIIGEIKRHFRDRGWAIRVPRRLQELRLAINRASSELSQELGRSPTVPEMAEHLNISEDEVLEGLQSAQAYATASIDSSSPDNESEDGGASLQDVLGSLDDAIEDIENRESLKPLLNELPERERAILVMRFFQDRTQSEIADELGISQMHVSRLLNRTLVKLRAGLGDEY